MSGSITDQDRKYLHEAVRLAMQGRGAVEPNPMVGCVIVREGRIIGSGYHAQFGGPHAEPTALANCTEPPAGATAYVTLEPCCHTNKKTPPCVPALIAAKLARVVVGTIDPNPAVSGAGIAQLRQAGIQVDLANDHLCFQLIAPFAARVRFGRPLITLKWAQTADGKVAGAGGQRLAISGMETNLAVHRLRSQCDAIVVGINTVLADDPILTIRGVKQYRPLHRVVLDSDLRLPPHSRLVRSTAQEKVLVFCSKEAAEYSGTRAALAANGVEIHPVPSTSPGRLDLPSILTKMLELKIGEILVEPGPTLAQNFLSANLFDRLWIIRSKIVLNEPTAPAAPTVSLPLSAEVPTGNDVVSMYFNPAGVYAQGLPGLV